MKYEGRWGPRAEQMLAAVWVAAAGRQAVTHAATWFDDQLAPMSREGTENPGLASSLRGA
jgi:hypothetical protein